MIALCGLCRFVGMGEKSRLCRGAFVLYDAIDVCPKAEVKAEVVIDG